MTQPRTQTVPLADGSELRLTVADPERAARGGIVVLHESRGMTDAVRRLVSNLAIEGWLVVAPHLFHREGTDEVGTDEQVAGQVSRLTGASVMIDTDAAFGWLAEHGVAADRIGVIGFDLGGSVALVVATGRDLGAAVTVAGSHVSQPLSDDLPAPLLAASELTCPWLGLFGELSEVPTLADIERLRDAAETSYVATDVVIYEGVDERFFDKPEVADNAWLRALNWFDSHLR